MELLPGAYNSPRWSYEILDCSMPMSFDTYNNCSFQCVYCFSFFQRAVGDGADNYLHHRVKSVNVEQVKRLFRMELPQSQFYWYIRSRRVLQWGGLSDGFDYYERLFGKSLDLLTFWNTMDYPLSISTKGVWFTEDARYQDAFRGRSNIHMKTSIVTLDADKARKVERGVAAPEERFRMLEAVNKLGVAATTVRLRPFILGITADYPYTAQSHDQIEALVHRTKEAGCYSLTTEFLCLERRASVTAHERYNILGSVCGIPNLFQFYTEQSPNAGLMRLNYDIKRPYMEALQEACAKHGIHFFVSDAHHKEKSEHAGCCGLPDTGPLSVTNKGQFAEAILIAKARGRVHWSDISEYAEELRHIPYGGNPVEGSTRPLGFNLGTTDSRAIRMYQTMYDYMRDMWNNPKSFMSPARYFGGALVPSAPDVNGDIVYLYNAPWVDRGYGVHSVKELQDTLPPETTPVIKLQSTAQQDVAKLQEEARTQMQDGGTWGLIAYDLCVNTTLCNLPRLRRIMTQLKQERLNATVFVRESDLASCETEYPGWGADFEALLDEPATEASRLLNDQAIIQGHMMLGTPRIWLISPKHMSLELPALRSTLSAVEAAYANGQQGTPLFLTNMERLRADYGITLEECAPTDHEVTI